MTREKDDPIVVRRVVVVFDISSSTTILEELKQCDQLHAWRNLLIEMKQFLLDQKMRLGLEIYKFLGDGWILFFPPTIEPSDLFQFLHFLSGRYNFLYFNEVTPFMQKDPRPVGITLGIDTGDLIQLTMNDQEEYLGRAINVAARLQGEAKSKAKGGFTNVALISKATFNALFHAGIRKDVGAVQTAASLRNISGGESFQCYELHLST